MKLIVKFMKSVFNILVVTISFSILLLFSCNRNEASKKQNGSDDKKEMYSILNLVIKEYIIPMEKKWYGKSDSLNLNEISFNDFFIMDSLRLIEEVPLSEKDASFIYKQIRDTAKLNFKIDYKRLNCSKIREVSIDSTGHVIGWDYAKGKDRYFKVSFPMCNQENNIGIVCVVDFCVDMCAHYDHIVLIKEKGNWKVSKVILGQDN